jgi:DNA-binding NarL/FixJ family response regulator
MKHRQFNIVIAETSNIIYEGIYNILNDGGQGFNIHFTDNLEEVQQINLRTKIDAVIINPLLIQNQIRHFQSLKKELEGSKWIGIVYTFIDQHLLTMLDGVMYINDSRAKIINTINKLIALEQDTENQIKQETLSDREIDVLKLLVAGNANKEIADKLNISTHTVITHRKNISQKTGIKSVSGLTIYAVVNNIISIEDYS